MAAALAAVGLYLAYIICFGVNVPHWDDWSIVPLLTAYQRGSLHFSQLWAQHNEHRMLVPNLIAVVVGARSRFNVKVEMYLGAMCLAAFVVTVIAALRSAAPRRWSDYAPIVVVMFMPVQWENALWGFQFALFLVMALLGACMYSLCRFRSLWGLAAAIVFATAASFTCLQGLLVWPAAGLLLWAGGRSRSSKVVWIAAGVVVWCAYFWHFSFDESGGGGLSGVFRHPAGDVKFFLTTLGGFALGWGGLGVAQLFGLGMLLLSLAVLYFYVRSDRTLVDAIPAVLVGYALLFDIALVVGRTGFGVVPALESRYVTYNLPIFLGVYLTLIDGQRWEMHRSGSAFRPFLMFGAGVLAVVLVLVSATRAVSNGRMQETQRNAAKSVLVNYSLSSNALLLQFLTFPTVANAVWVREWAPYLQQLHYSVFASHADVAALQIIGPRDSAHSLLPRHDLLPVSSAVSSALPSSIHLQDAWAVLSTVYFSRPDLQRAFPINSPDLDQNVLAWAVQIGSTKDYDMLYLGPELSSFKRLYHVALSS
jgi:hypothetical protein